MDGRFYGAAPNRLIGQRPNAAGRGRTDGRQPTWTLSNFKAGPFTRPGRAAKPATGTLRASNTLRFQHDIAAAPVRDR
jgi:hypothetical protein